MNSTSLTLYGWVGGDMLRTLFPAESECLAYGRKPRKKKIIVEENYCLYPRKSSISIVLARFFSKSLVIRISSTFALKSNPSSIVWKTKPKTIENVQHAVQTQVCKKE